MRHLRNPSLLLAMLALAACTSTPFSGISGSEIPPPDPPPPAAETHAAPTPFYAVGGTVSGLSGAGLVLRNGDDEIRIPTNGTFFFPKKLAAKGAFAVSVAKQPIGPTQTCTVSGGTGTVVSGNVTTIAVTCATDAFALGGTVSGLSGAGLVLKNGQGEQVTVAANGTFAFPKPMLSGGTYAVSVVSQPSSPSQTCTVANAEGKIDAAKVTDIAVTCTTNTYAVGGTISGVAGSGLVLSNNGIDDISISQSGVFTFSTPIESGAAFDVKVKTQPNGPPQTCTVAGGTGTVGGGDVTSIAIDCATNKYSIAGSASGLEGTGLVLQNNGADDLTISANGSFAFSNPIESATPYAVSIKSQPTSPSQTCALTGASGIVGSADVTDVGLTCTTNEYRIGGSVSGLAGSGLVLQNDAGDDLLVGADGTFQFATPVKSGATYSVTVKGKPTSPSQTCAVVHGVGKVADQDIADIAIACTTDAFTVGGSVAGLAGSGLVLQNAGGDDLPIAADGSFTFPSPVTSGNAFAVTVKNQPSDPSQTCSVIAGSGTVTNGNIGTVAVNCTTNRFAIGGSVHGLAGIGLVLQNEGGDELVINNNGTFAFPSPIASGSSYAVSVKIQPLAPSQTCTVDAGSGNVGAGDVSSISVTCTTSSFALGGTITGLGGGTAVIAGPAGETLSLSTEGPFTFATKVASGSSYAVTVATHPVGRYCVVKQGSGTMGGADVSSVAIECVVSNGSVRDVSGTVKRILYRPCGDGSVEGCTKAVAEASCTAVGARLVSHASDGTSGVVSLGATDSCDWSVSYYTNDAPELAGQCLVAISNADWSQCCTTSDWHGNTLTIPSTVGEQFGYVSAGSTGYNSALTNVSGATWGCQPLTEPPSAQEGCSTYNVACMW